MGTVRAKFKVTNISRAIGGHYVGGIWMPGEIRTVTFLPVQDGSVENKRFWDATPSGQISLGCANLEAVEQFELDHEYYVDFTRVAPGLKETAPEPSQTGTPIQPE